MALDFLHAVKYNSITVKEQSAGTEFGGKCQKGKSMDEEMNAAEIAVKLAEQNQTRKIIDLSRECKTVEEALQKIRALLDQ